MDKQTTDSDVINFYIVSEFRIGLIPSFLGRAIGIPSNSAIIDNDFVLAPTAPHELGHCLNLYHTFQGSSADRTLTCAEAIDGSNCKTCGDLVCDTPADENNRNNRGYRPDLTNIMSYYYPKTHIDHFTDGQGERMRTAISQEPVLSSITSSCTTPSLSPLDHLCNPGTKTITVSNLEARTTTWQVSSNVRIVASNNASITIKAKNSNVQGNAFVKASFSDVKAYYHPTEYFWIGKPKLDGYISGSSSVNCSNIYIYDFTGTVGGASSTRWIVGAQLDNISSANKYELFVDPTNGGDGYITFVASNECGEDIICQPVTVSGGLAGRATLIFPPHIHAEMWVLTLMILGQLFQVKMPLQISLLSIPTQPRWAVRAMSSKLHRKPYRWRLGLAQFPERQ